MRNKLRQATRNKPRPLKWPSLNTYEKPPIISVGNKGEAFSLINGENKKHPEFNLSVYLTKELRAI
jgi:hypothetical protein